MCSHRDIRPWGLVLELDVYFSKENKHLRWLLSLRHSLHLSNFFMTLLQMMSYNLVPLRSSKSIFSILMELWQNPMGFQAMTHIFEFWYSSRFKMATQDFSGKSHIWFGSRYFWQIFDNNRCTVGVWEPIKVWDQVIVVWELKECRISALTAAFHVTMTWQVCMGLVRVDLFSQGLGETFPYKSNWLSNADHFSSAYI